MTTADSKTSVLEDQNGIPIRNIWHMMMYAWNLWPALRRVPPALKDIEDSPTLDALLAKVLIHLMQQRLRVGLGRSYRDEEAFIRGIRGKLQLARTARSRCLERSQAYCRFQQFSPDVPKNQIVRSVLYRLQKAGEFGPDKPKADELRHRLRQIVQDLDGIALIEVRQSLIQRQQLGRSDSDYQLMLEVCRLILQRFMPTESAGDHRLLAAARDALVLHDVYEKFVANFYKVRLTGWLVTAQARLQWPTESNSPYVPSMKPDIVLKEKASGRMLVIDTKFTPHSLAANAAGELRFQPSHLYQMYAYLRTQAHHSETHAKAWGVLLYPTARYHLSEDIDLLDHSISVRSLDLHQPWDQVEQELLAVATVTSG